MDQTGLNLLRIVIGSYFMALSLDLVAGLDVATLFRQMLPHAVADIVGSTLLLCLSAAVMAGYQLRLAALSLALLVFCSSLVQNLMVVTPESLSAFWRDLALATAVLLTYLTLGPRALRRASVLAHRARARHALAKTSVNPRRITPQATQKRPVQQEIRNALAVTTVSDRLHPATQEEPELKNIFSNM